MRSHCRLALLFSLALASSCAPQENDEQIVLRISNWGGAGEEDEFARLVKGFYKQFEKENPGVKVQIENNPDGYVQKMMLNFVAGTEPDIMVVDASSAAVFINNGVLANVMPMTDSGPDYEDPFDLSNYFPNVLQIGRRDPNNLYTIPSDFTPMVMYYNKDLFDAAGVPYPKPGWNFQDFVATAKKLTNSEKKQYGFVLPNWMPGWVMWLWNNGAEVLSPDGKKATGYFDSPKAVETIKYLRDLVNKEKVAPSLGQIASTGVDKFANGEVAMTVSGHWALVGYKTPPKKDGKPAIDWKRLGVVELPHNTPQSQTVMYSAGYGITRRSKHKDLAWKFIRMWTSHKVQLAYNKSGIAISARQDVAKQLAQEPIDRQFLDIVPQARPPAGSWVEGYEIVENEGRKAMDAILNNPTADVQSTLTRAAKRIDHEFAKRL